MNNEEPKELPLSINANQDEGDGDESSDANLTTHQSPSECASRREDEIPSDSNSAKAWSRVVASWLLFVASWGPALAFAAFEEYYNDHLLSSYSTSSIAWIGSVSTTLLITLGGIAGPLFDRGFLKQLMALGCFLAIFAFMMLSLCNTYWQVFLAQGICYGIGSGLVFVPGLAFVIKSFGTKQRPIAVGITATGSSAGGVIFPILFSHLQPRVGFAWTCRTIAFIQLFCSLIAGALLYDAPVKKSKPRKLIQWTAFRSMSFTAFFITSFCMFLAYWIPLFYVPAFAASNIPTASSVGLTSVYFLVLINAASAFGRIIPAFLVRKFGAPVVSTVATFLAAILLFCWIPLDFDSATDSSPALGGFVTWTILFGFITGVFVSAVPIFVTHPVIAPSLEFVGTRLGMLWFAGGVGALIGTPIAGVLANPGKGEFLKAQIFAAVIMSVAALGCGFVYWRSLVYDRWERRMKSTRNEEEKEGV